MDAARMRKAMMRGGNDDRDSDGFFFLSSRRGTNQQAGQIEQRRTREGIDEEEIR
jgi:hypothetical protein